MPFLPSPFVESYRAMRPRWGFPSGPNALGEITYRRTYSRDGETWPDTVRRVVEGTFEILEGHCRRHAIPFDEALARRDAREMFERIWSFKFTPPGRGLWMMGTDFVRNRTGAPLFNCGFASTKDIDQDPAKPFCFLMDMSMLGVGVGFDARGAGKVTWRQRRDSHEHVIPDTREGWVDSLRALLLWCFHLGPKPKFIYDYIRKENEPIRGFGGVSSGPGPLIVLHQRIERLAHQRRGQPISTQDIGDIGNMIGCCVVAGNVRRTAEVYFGEASDDVFLDLKNYERFPERSEWGWASNNSVFASVGMDYGEAARRTSVNGEPGYFWLDNVRAYGRMCEPPNNKDYRVLGANPCVVGDTLILTKEYGDRPISSLVGQFVHVWNGEQWSEAVPQVTGRDQDLVRVKLCGPDRGTREIVCTLYHNFELINKAEFTQAKDLDVGNRLQPYYVPGVGFVGWSVYDVEPAGRADLVYCFHEPLANRGTFNGVVTGQCLEQSLEHLELCDLVENFIQHHEDLDDFKKSLKYSYLYAKAVTLVGTHWPETNAIMLRNRRIGTSLSGVVQFLTARGRKELIRWCEEGYQTVLHYDRVYSEWLCIRESIKTTSIKPSGCRPWYSLTTTDRGILTLSELTVGHPEGKEWAGVEGVRCLRPDGPAAVSKSYDNGVSEVLRLRLTFGVELDCTPNHRWFVRERYDHDRTPRHAFVGEWVPASEIRPGDVIDFSAGLYRSVTAAPFRRVNLRAVKMRSDSSPIRQPAEMTADLAWLFGYLWGDGAQSPGHWRIRFSDENRFNLEKASRVIEEHFGVKGVLRRGDGRADWELTVASVQLWHWLIGQGVWKYYDEDGTIDLIPEVVRRSSREHVIAFVAGLLDADGGCYTINGGKISPKITSAEEKFTAHLQHVMWAVGIPCGRSLMKGSEGHLGDGCYCITVSPGLCDPEALLALEAHSNKVRRCRDENPLAVYGDKVSGTPGKVTGVESIGLMPTYDIEVPDGNYYYAGAFRSHNTVSLLAGVTPGCHYPTYRHYIRRVRFGKNHHDLGDIVAAGYRAEPDVRDPDTTVVEFPVKGPDVPTEDEVSVEEKLDLAATLQAHWADNQVSVTATFDPDTEGPKIPRLLKKYERRLKAVSFLPMSKDSMPYPQMPYEPISEEEYERRVRDLKPIVWTRRAEHDHEDRFCDGKACEIRTTTPTTQQ